MFQHIYCTDSALLAHPITHQVTSATCVNKPLDVAFLVDKSGSINDHEWRTSKEFLEQIIGEFWGLGAIS